MSFQIYNDTRRTSISILGQTDLVQTYPRRNQSGVRNANEAILEEGLALFLVIFLQERKSNSAKGPHNRAVFHFSPVEHM